jgi:hypothetical protein
MDMMGDGEEFAYDDEGEPPVPRQPLVTSEALAVTSLAAAVCSLLVTGVSQYLIFLLAQSLGLVDEADQDKQFALYMTPTAVMSVAAIGCGVIAIKRRPEDRWVGALAFAGVVVGVLTTLLAAVGLALALTQGTPQNVIQ